MVFEQTTRLIEAGTAYEKADAASWARARLRRVLSPVAMIAIGALLSTKIPASSLMIWLGCYCATVALDLIVSEGFVRQAQRRGDPARAQWFIIAGQLLVNSTVASVGIWGWTPFDYETNLLILFILHYAFLTHVSGEAVATSHLVIVASPFAIVLLLAPWLGEARAAPEMTLVAAMVLGFGIAQAKKLERSAGQIDALSRSEDGLRKQLASFQQTFDQTRSAGEQMKASHRSILEGVEEEIREPLLDLMKLAGSLPLGEPQDDERAKQVARQINASCVRLQGFSQDIADLNRIETGQLGVRSKRIDLVDVLRVTGQECAALLAGSQLTLETIIDPDLPFVMADDRLILRVLINLITNAARETVSNGRVTISALRLPDGGLGLRVSSSGILLSETDLDEAFEALLAGKADPRLGINRSNRLSLLIVKMLSERLGGSLSIRSRFGSGIQATVHFPPELLFPKDGLVRIGEAA